MNNLKLTKPNLSFCCAIIPFYNEKETINTVISETLNFVEFIYAVNDGSTDGFQLALVNKPGLEIINLDKNYGKGIALSKGFERAVSEGFTKIITIDADMQHKPEYIPSLVEGLRKFDIVIGNRLKNLKGMPLQRRLSNKLTSFFLTVKTGQEIIDSQCGFRAYKSDVLKNVKTHFSGFEAESEILVQASLKGFKIGFVDIPTIYENQNSKMRPVQAIIGFLRVMFS